MVREFDLGLVVLGVGFRAAGVTDLAGDNCDDNEEGAGESLFGNKAWPSSASVLMIAGPNEVFDDMAEAFDGVLPILRELEVSSEASIPCIKIL